MLRSDLASGEEVRLQNLILASLGRHERARLDPFLEGVTLSGGDVLVEAGKPIRYLWFLENAVGAVVQITPSGAHIPSGIMGYEGVAGFELWLRHSRSPLSSVAYIGGDALRMRAEDFDREVLGTRSPMNDLLADYVFGYITLASQISACNRQHGLEERLCRWLRMISVRIPEKKSFHLCPEFLASLLFAERSTATITITARVLHSAGLIHYQDENIRILDEAGLEEGACECYPLFHAQFHRMHRRSA